MKYLKIGMACCALLALAPYGLLAQDAETPADAVEELALTDSLTSVQLAFRKVNVDDLPADVAVVDVQELMESAYSSSSLFGMSAFVGGYNGNIWGLGDVLVLIDGVPRSSSYVRPSEIEHISFLKGVSAVALYGSRAAKGVVSITTRRGKAETQKIHFRANAGFHVPKSYPKYLGSAEYMTLYNEARVNDGLEPLYSEEDVYNHGSGLNPYRYPDVDFFSSDYLKSSYNFTDVSAEVVGGGKNARYYTNFGYDRQGSLLDFGQAVDNNSSNRFNVRGNIDVDINEAITSYINANAIFYTAKGVNADYWSSSAILRPNRVAPLLPIDLLSANDEASQTLVNNSNYLIDGKYLLGGTQLDQSNAFADVYAGGTNKYNSRQFQFDAGINADLSGLLQGLSFQTMFAFDYATLYNLSFDNEYSVYEATWNNYGGTDQVGSLTKYGKDAKTGAQSVSGSWYDQTLAFSGQLNYNRVFNDAHKLSIMAIASGYQMSESGIYHRTSNANLGMHLAYSFNKKYAAEFNGALVHSARLPEGNRSAFNPTASLAWRLNEEGFMSGIQAINDLRLTASAGILHTDLDVEQYYLYQGYYTHEDAAYHGWRDGVSRKMYDRRRGANPDLTFPRREEFNLGLDAALFQHKLRLNTSFFVNKMTGNIVQAGVLYPSYFSTGYPEYSDVPYTNYNEDQRMGVDFSATYSQQLGDFNWTLGVSGLWFDSEALKRAENYDDSYQNRAGKAIDGLWGLESNGFFADEAAIAAAPRHSFGEVKPGDLSYVDQNNDEVIDSKDVVFLGKAGWFGTPFSGGLHLKAEWKNISVFALASARFGAYAFKNDAYNWVYGDRKYSEVVRGRWTEETQATATYPRLTTQSGDNNFRASDFWMYSTDRFDLAQLQLSYNFSSAVVGNLGLDQLGLYLAAYNLFTAAPEREMLELNVGSTPQTRFFNLGLKAVF
ncbi:SusC/RagA family TonB-linked outer membrane protein [Geofilum rhodophaeum]|uniref:SusC/RagA family TonB-linked outer membrane protein n=1 Tax=Geofilum rhodophaeum TaxID=1965019 RepID=UPI000B526FA3|nr:SusC/RagA family TonB-linked outer membrane protein [Geofilum rhodophaeum]